MKLPIAALALILYAPSAPVSAAEPLGRLFYTPDQRAALDVARTKRTRASVAAEKAEEPPPAPTSEMVTYGGVVRRSDGKTTVWLNNNAVTEKQAAGTKMVGKIRPDGSVTLQSAQSGRNVELRVGQRAELLSGRIEEGYRQSPGPKAEVKGGDATGLKSAPEGSAATDAERRKEEREQRENLDDAVRALREAAAAKSAGTAPQQQPAGAPAQVPGQAPAQAAK